MTERQAQADPSNPILNSPYDPPESHFELGPNGPTGKILTGRRPSESFIPVQAPKKGHKAEQEVVQAHLWPRLRRSE
jgi:type III restriction enzyme